MCVCVCARARVRVSQHLHSITIPYHAKLITLGKRNNTQQGAIEVVTLFAPAGGHPDVGGADSRSSMDAMRDLVGSLHALYGEITRHSAS